MTRANRIDRRKALTTIAAAPVAVAVVGAAAITTGEPGELVALIRQFWQEVDASMQIRQRMGEHS
ncbi:MAG: hypothetical protein ACREDO_09130 [Methyloceanibacter sp.]